MDYAYNGFGELSSQQVSGPQGPLYREGYPERDQLGRLTKRVVGTDPATAVTHGYVYHPQRGWLTQHKLNDSLADAWSYDVRGNRVGKHIGLSGQVTATVDAQDRLVQLGAEALAYDLNGRVVARSGGQLPATYVWDAFGRLREARLNPSQPTEIAVAYGLDPAGRRVRAVAKDAGGAVLDDRSWVYDGQLRVGSLSASGNLRARYLYASSGHSPDLAVRFDPASGAVTGSYLLVHDQVGSAVRTVDLATGVAVESVAYDPWGVATVAPGGTAVHPFGFAGGLWDRRTGLVRFGAREYDAGLGRWLARDPIGFAGGWNHYGYAGGDPVGRVDPDGLSPVDLDPSMWQEYLDDLPGESQQRLIDFQQKLFGWVLDSLPLPGTLPGRLLPWFEKACRAARAERTLELIRDFLGPGGSLSKNKNGDFLFLSSDKKKQVRFDYYNPDPHKNPHSHVNWGPSKSEKSKQIYPTDVPHY